MSDIQRIRERLDQALSQFVQDHPIPGLAVGIVKDYRTIYAKGFGVSNVTKGEPVDEKTLFHMASVSKTLVATGIMQLAERGKMNLDGYVTEYLPYFTLSDDRFRLITVRQLLNHTSGMPDEDDYEWDRPQYDKESLERYVKSIDDRQLMWHPGEQFFYSNIGYEILGDIIAKVSGVSFEQYIKENVLRPTGMDSSSFLKTEADDGQLATPHILGLTKGYGAEVSEIFPYNRAHAPSSTLYASAEEMCRYAIAQLHQGDVPGGQRILQQVSYNELWKKYASTDYGAEMEGIGLSWFLGEYKGIRMVSHAGRDTGFRSNLILLPDEGIAVSVMTNSDYVGLKIVYTTILDVLLGEDISRIKRSIAHHLAQITDSSGVDAAMKEYADIQQNNPDRYLVLQGEFNFIADTLKERGFSGEAGKLLQLSSMLFPEAS
ncbi:serine hydrolase domain-containing protein [Cohnella kolymensis]|uniref:serine hydrolase domain-containing protein n=1 Tax=Cohnella kolymensis TaxID=1590652 RepID=UPI000698E382|nr:serine hydrolase domain-containing protein [Cohnella kolymensis]